MSTQIRFGPDSRVLIFCKFFLVEKTTTWKKHQETTNPSDSFFFLSRLHIGRNPAPLASLSRTWMNKRLVEISPGPSRYLRAEKNLVGLFWIRYGMVMFSFELRKNTFCCCF